MVMATPSPQQVGREFVRQYYTVLHEAPEVLHRFYNSGSTFVHGGVDRPGHAIEEPVIGQLEIDKKIRLLNFKDCHTKIRQVDSQATIGNGVVVQVTGELSNNGEPMRRFMQTFVLAPQTPKKYYVHNDIFRYQDEVYQDLSDAESEEPAVSVSTAASAQPNVPTPGAAAAAAAPQQVEIKTTTITGDYYQSNDANLIVQRQEQQETQVILTTPANLGVTPVNEEPVGGNMEAQLNGHLHSSTSSSSSSSSSSVSSEKNTLDSAVTPAETPIEEEKQQQQQAANVEVAKKPSETVVNVQAPVKESGKQESDTKNSWAKIITNRSADGAAVSSVSSNQPSVNSQSYSSNSLPRNNTNKDQTTNNKKNGPNSSQPHHNGTTPPPTQANKNQQQQQQPNPSSKSRNSQSFNNSNHQQPVNNHQQQQQQQQQQQPQQQRTNSSSGSALNASTAPVATPGPVTNGVETIEDIEKRFGRYPDGQQVFVGNLSQDLSEHELKQFFNQYGKVIEVRINTNTKQQSGRRLPNYGFVVFDDKQTVDNLLGASKSNNLLYKNDKGVEHRLNVEEKRARQGRQSGFGGGGNNNNNNSGGGGGGPKSSNRATRSTSNGSRGGATNGNGPNPNKKSFYSNNTQIDSVGGANNTETAPAGGGGGKRPNFSNKDRK